MTAAIINNIWHLGNVKAVEERFHTVCVSGVGKDAIMENVSDGWYIVLNTGVSLNFGRLKPDCEPGDDVRVEFRRSRHKGE